jgi:hypothetical protein
MGVGRRNDRWRPIEILPMHPIEQLEMPRMVHRRVFEKLPQAISDFLADRTAMNAIDLHIGVAGQSRHETSNPLVLKPQAPDQCSSHKSVSPCGRRSGDAP